MTALVDELLLSAADVEIQATGKPITVSIVAYTGGLMVVPGWGPVVIDLSGVDTTAEQISLLADHDASLKGIVGHGRAVVANGKLLVQGTITPSTEAARQVIELARSGFRFQASVGVTPIDQQRIRAGETIEVNGRAIKAPTSGFTLVRAGVLREVSIVAMAADRGTSVAIAAKLKDHSMTETATLTAEEIRAEALAETTRITAIRDVCNGKFGEIEAQAIDEGWTEQQTELAVLRASRPKPTLSFGRREATSKAVLEAALLAHMGCDHLAEKHLGADTAQQAHELRATNLIDLCRTALMLDGKEAPHGREGLIRAALSTFSLPVALGDAANKVLMESYTESPATWRAFAAVKSTNDFKDHTGVRPSDTGELQQLPPGGEIKHGSVKEATYTFSVDTFAKMLRIDRRDIINDDLSMFDDTARSLGRAAMRSLSDLVYKVLLVNANAFFGTPHGNYDAGAPTMPSPLRCEQATALVRDDRNDARQPNGCVTNWPMDAGHQRTSWITERCAASPRRRCGVRTPRSVLGRRRKSSTASGCGACQSKVVTKMTKMATDPLLFFVAIFGELAIFEVGHIPEDALKKPYKYEDGHEIAVREREKDSLGKKRRWPHDTKMATKRNRGMLAKFAVGNFGRSP